MATTYRANAGRQRIICGCCFILAANLSLLTWSRDKISPRDLILMSCVVVFGLVALRFLANMVMGLPRLTLDGQGVVLRSMFRSRSAQWHRLGAFTLVASSSKPGARVLSASAPLVGPSGDPRNGSRQFTIPDLFEAPLSNIVSELAIVRRNIQGPYAPSRTTRTLARPMGASDFRLPWLTTALAAIFIVVFVLEQHLAVTPGPADMVPSSTTLVALGALDRRLILSGEWYRLITAPFLHANLNHLFWNGVAFLLAGCALEYLVGRIWLCCIFAGGALAGSLMSMTLMAANGISVGASGAIMAMMVTLFLISFRLPPGKGKTHIQFQSARVVIPAVIPIHQAAAAMHVDYGAHFGGALFGAAVGLVLLWTWHDDAELPPRGAAMLLAAMVLVLTCFGGAGAVAWQYPSYDQAALLIPTAMLPRDQSGMNANADALAAAYPRDPRGYLYRGTARLQRQDFRGAETALRSALPLLGTTERLLGRSVTSTVQAGLALALYGQGRKQEASMIARAPCDAKDDAAPDMRLRVSLTHFGLCDVPAGLSAAQAGSPRSEANSR